MKIGCLARTLRARGAHDAVVGYWGERDLDWATAVVAIAKAGSTYLPLDPSLPFRVHYHDRAESLRAGCWPGATEFDRPTPDEQQSTKFMAIEAALGEGQTPLLPLSSENGPAYILFTSGSTGQPKGAVIERAALNNHLAAKIDALALTRTDCVAQTASHCFDISLWQLLAGLCVGGCVAIIDDTTLRSPVLSSKQFKVTA
ncbi:AMP-binding protein [Bradyrhizobium elkanii]|uniref:AMP-binding protein n=1 Tax=Bradyrhizobium elkanii TaxID=29448 RepID=UPI0034E5A4B3